MRARKNSRWCCPIVKPKFFIPIHGMYRQLHRHAKLAEKSGAVREQVILAETGDIIRSTPMAARSSARPSRASVD
jgi:ribonuclease J